MTGKNVLFVFFLISLCTFGSLVSCDRVTNSPPMIMLPSSLSPTATPASWLRLPQMPDSATQADYGAEIYRLVCQDCHGDRGQGLTDEWRSTWAPEDQNCWQSRCHASNHPPEGFILPTFAPPLLGPGSLSNHETALDLYNYIRLRMPFHNPGSLQDWEYMQLTAFLVRERELAVDLPLDATGAANLILSP